MMRIVERGVVFRAAAGSQRQSATFPGVAVAPNGRWWCTFRAAPLKGIVGSELLLTYSDDEGRTWTKPRHLFVGVSVDGRRGVICGGYITPLRDNRLLIAMSWVDQSDPTRPFFNEQTEGLLDTHIYLSWSDDTGRQWSRPQMMDTTPFDCPTPLTGPVLRLANGELACQFETNKHYHDPKPWHHKSVLMFSRDGGETWPEHCVVTHDPQRRYFWWDQRPGVLDDGHILDLFWSYDNVEAKYINIQARASRDHGRTWSAMWNCGVQDQPAQPVSLAEGYTCMVYVDRRHVPTIKARTSSDGGRTWPQETELILYAAQPKSQTEQKASMQDAWAEMGRFSVGLPATTRLANGDVLVVYYAGPETDQTGIEWARLHPDS